MQERYNIDHNNGKCHVLALTWSTCWPLCNLGIDLISVSFSDIMSKFQLFEFWIKRFSNPSAKLLKFANLSSQFNHFAPVQTFDCIIKLLQKITSKTWCLTCLHTIVFISQAFKCYKVPTVNYHPFFKHTSVGLTNLLGTHCSYSPHAIIHLNRLWLLGLSHNFYITGQGPSNSGIKWA